MPSPQYFDGHAMVSWSDHDITVAVPWYIGLMFRTRQSSTTATLMQANAGSASQINLQVSQQLRMHMFYLFKQICCGWLGSVNFFFFRTNTEYVRFFQHPHNAFSCLTMNEKADYLTVVTKTAWGKCLFKNSPKIFSSFSCSCLPVPEFLCLFSCRWWTGRCRWRCCWASRVWHCSSFLRSEWMTESGTTF